MTGFNTSSDVFDVKWLTDSIKAGTTATLTGDLNMTITSGTVNVITAAGQVITENTSFWDAMNGHYTSTLASGEKAFLVLQDDDSANVYALYGMSTEGSVSATLIGVVNGSTGLSVGNFEIGEISGN